MTSRSPFLGDSTDRDRRNDDRPTATSPSETLSQRNWPKKPDNDARLGKGVSAGVAVVSEKRL